MLELSIIIVSHNRFRDLSKLVESICKYMAERKRFERYEIVIVDNLSKESTRIKSFIRSRSVNDPVFVDVKVKLVELKTNSGPGNARRVGLDFSEGEFVKFVDDDDEIMMEGTEEQVAIMRTSCEWSGLSSAWLRRYHDTNCEERKFSNVATPSEIYISLLKDFRHLGSYIFKRKDLQSSGVLSPSYWLIEDVYTVISIVKNGGTIQFIDSEKPVYRQFMDNDDISLSRTSQILFINGIYRNLELVWSIIDVTNLSQCGKEVLGDAYYYCLRVMARHGDDRWNVCRRRLSLLESGYPARLQTLRYRITNIIGWARNLLS